jgi:hypothetical protein
MSTINLTLSEELDQKLRTEATKQGVEPDRYILNALITNLQPAALTEASLLNQINTGLSQDAWQSYHALIKKRQAETLTGEEHTQLIELTTRLETLNVQRIQSLMHLATLRSRTLDEVMQDLGINTELDVLDHG